MKICMINFVSGIIGHCTEGRNSLLTCRNKNCSELSLFEYLVLVIFANSRPSAWNFESFSQSLEQFFLTVGQDNVGKKIPFL
jgi:hypothetical protein